jgi:hypothetical protein
MRLPSCASSRPFGRVLKLAKRLRGFTRAGFGKQRFPLARSRE